MESVARLRDTLHLVCIVAAGRRRRKGLAVLLKENDRLFDNLAELVKDGPFILAVASTVDESGRAPERASLACTVFESRFRM